MKSKETIICKICGKVCNIRGLSNHLTNQHKNINHIEYYDTYIDSSSHMCTCGKKLKFYTLVKGYRHSCGDNECKQKLYEEAYFKKTGYKNCWSNPEVVERKKQKYFEKTGYKNPFQNPECIQTMKETKQERYGNENYVNIEQIKQTKLEKYGDANYGCYGSESFKNLMEEKYGNRDYRNVEQIKKTWANKTEEDIQESNFKRMKTMFNKFGVFHMCMIQDGAVSKISQEAFWNIYNKLPEDLKLQTKFSELNYEFMVGDSFNQKIYYIDFAIPSIKFCLEFNGDYWHRNPKFYNENESKSIWKKDYYRKLSIEQEGFMLYNLWEDDYRKNKDFWIDDILFYINILKESFLND